MIPHAPQREYWLKNKDYVVVEVYSVQWIKQ
jgi:hypothetical protein